MIVNLHISTVSDRPQYCLWYLMLLVLKDDDCHHLSATSAPEGHCCAALQIFTRSVELRALVLLHLTCGDMGIKHETMRLDKIQWQSLAEYIRAAGQLSLCTPFFIAFFCSYLVASPWILAHEGLFDSILIPVILEANVICQNIIKKN